MTLYPGLQESIDGLDRQVSEQTQQRPDARRLMTHPGVGPITALATEVFLGDPLRFSDGKALASYIGMIRSRAVQWRPAAAGCDEQTRERTAALSVV